MKQFVKLFEKFNGNPLIKITGIKGAHVILMTRAIETAPRFSSFSKLGLKFDINYENNSCFTIRVDVDSHDFLTPLTKDAKKYLEDTESHVAANVTFNSFRNRIVSHGIKRQKDSHKLESWYWFEHSQADVHQVLSYILNLSASKGANEAIFEWLQDVVVEGLFKSLEKAFDLINQDGHFRVDLPEEWHVRRIDRHLGDAINDLW